MGIAIVSGATSGIGAEFVKQIDQSKSVSEIWGIARNEAKLEETAKNISTPFKPVKCDLSDTDDIENIGKLLKANKPGVKLLINCAGFAAFGNYNEIPVKNELSMIDVDVRAVVDMCRTALPYMGEGDMILNVASTAAFQPLPAMNVYAASKAFVLNYSRALNFELQTRGISVTALCPGWTKTNFFDVAKNDGSKTTVSNFPFMSTPEKVARSGLKAALKHRAVCVPGITNKIHWFFAKILPAPTVMGLWSVMK